MPTSILAWAEGRRSRRQHYLSRESCDDETEFQPFSELADGFGFDHPPGLGAAALRAAKLTMLKSATPAYRHPIFLGAVCNKQACSERYVAYLV
jgi:hypothetical protein